MIYDVHCHILPGVDDGSKDDYTTERMLQIAAAEGIGAIIATPHFSCADSEADLSERKRRHLEVSELWKAYGEDKKLYLGNELFYSDGMVDALSEGRALTINGTRYVLVEFPVYAEFSYIQKAVQELQYAGYYPIIAHVERYPQVKGRKLLQELVEMGAYIQVNTSALLGKHGFGIKRFAVSGLRRGMIHFVATDAHGARHRRPEFKECKAFLEKKLGAAHTQRILEKNPERMLRGERLDG